MVTILDLPEGAGLDSKRSAYGCVNLADPVCPSFCDAIDVPIDVPLVLLSSCPQDSARAEVLEKRVALWRSEVRISAQPKVYLYVFSFFL